MYVWKSTKRSKLKCSLTSRRGRRLNHLSVSLSFSLRNFFCLCKKCIQWFICGTTDVHLSGKALVSKGEVDHLSFLHLRAWELVRLYAYLFASTVFKFTSKLLQIWSILCTINDKFVRLGDPLDEIVFKFSIVMHITIWHRDIIRELGNRCHAELLHLHCILI